MPPSILTIGSFVIVDNKDYSWVVRKDDDLNMTKGDDFLIEEEKGFEIRFSNDESIDDDIIFEDIEGNNSDEIPDEVFN